MSWKNYPRKPLAQAVAVAVVATGLGMYVPKLMAATEAGTQIRNLATVTYEDAAGNVFSAQSNEAIVTVAQIYSATLGVDVDITGAPGQTVYLPYVLTNTGNGTDTYDLSAVNGITGGDNIDSANIVVFEDVNGNGLPDAGEPSVTSLTLPPNVNNSANLVVAVDIPATATDTQTLGIRLTAQAQEGTGSAVVGSVTDLTPGGGRDTLNDTNESLITVTGDAVLQTTKSSVHDAANNTITYTVTVTNNGGVAAQNVVIFDGIPDGTTYDSQTVSGLLATNGDTIGQPLSVLSEAGLGLDLNGDGDITDGDETALGLDLNTDGDTADVGIQGVYVVDSELPPNTTVTMTMTVTYDPAVLGGGAIIENTGHAAGDLDGDPLTPDGVVTSNVVQDTVNGTFGVIITDTGIASPGVNDGGDDDANAANDTQFVDEASAGGAVRFLADITNQGNSPDTFELSVAPGTFPAGTVFNFYDSTGTVPLSDSNGVGGIDSAIIAAGATQQIMIIATLPSNASGNLGGGVNYEATVTATSAGDPTAPPASDPMTLALGNIIQAVVDISNTAAGIVAGTDEDALAAAPGPYSAVTTFTGTTGSVINIPLFLDNETGGSDSYSLAAGSSWDGTTLGALPPGWTVEFFLNDGAGNPTGPALTNTPAIPGNTADFGLVAVVTVSNSALEAIGNYEFDNNGDGTPDILDGNADGTVAVPDGDYPIFFQVTSINSGATDIKLDAVDIDPTRNIALVTPGINQVQAGNSVTYGHTLSNSGNVNESIELTSANSAATFTHTLSIDVNGDGVADTEIGNLVAGTPITVQQPNGVDVVVQVTDTDNDGTVELVLEPGVELPLTAVVFAAANAAPGTVDALTINADNVDPTGPSVTLTDQTTVVSGQVRLDKSVAVDTDCDGTADTGFLPVQTTGVEPGQCVIWQVIAENQGSVDANNVLISDAIPAFSTYVANSLNYCLSTGCALGPVTDGAGDDAGEINAGNIVFYVGTGSNPATGDGGVLIPGEQATVTFRVIVD